MRRGFNLYSGLLDGLSLKDAISAHCQFQMDPHDSGFEKTLLLVSERHELLLLCCAMADFILSNDLEPGFRSFIFNDF